MTDQFLEFLEKMKSEDVATKKKKKKEKTMRRAVEAFTLQPSQEVTP